MIEFYDIPSTLPEIAWSPNTWKARYTLNYKGIPYKTIWVEYPDIAETYKSKGIAPPFTKRDGTPYYTLPFIHDPSTGKTISNSILIAEYLEETYPDTPRVFPPGTRALQKAFYLQYERHQLVNMDLFVIPTTASILNPRSAEWFKADRGRMFGGDIDKLYPKGEQKEKLWKGWEEEWGVVDGWMKDTNTLLVMEDKITWADFVVAGWVIWCRSIFGAESEQWKDIASWHNGRWARLLERLSEYETVV